MLIDASPSRRLSAIELLGTARLFDPTTFYGQNALKATLLRNTAAEVDWHLVGNAPVDAPTPSPGTYHCITGENQAGQFRAVIDSFGSRQRPVAVFSSFPVQSAALTLAVLRAADVSSRIALHPIFHCTAQELLPHLFGGGQTPRAVAEAIAVAASQARRLVFVSEAIRASFELPEVVAFLGLDSLQRARSVVIPNAIDPSWLIHAPGRGVVRQDESTFIVGSLAGFKPYKGRDIITALLRTAQESEFARSWKFAMPALPNYGTRDLLEVLHSEFSDLVEAGRMALFIDVSQWIDLVPEIVIWARREYADFRSDLPAHLRRCADRCFVGVSSLPVSAQFSVQIRPSIHEGFGRAVVESFLLGIPVIGSDRDALRTLLPADCIIPFPSEISLAAAVTVPQPASYVDMCGSLGRAFLQRLSTLQHAPRVRASELTARAKRFLDTRRVVEQYMGLIRAA